MRVLFASLGSAGHTYPLIPLAVAARDSGHEVHFATGEHVHASLAEHGLRPFRPADAFYEIYAEDLLPDLERLQPDLVIHEWGVPGAAIAAHRAGIPGIWHGFGRMFPDGIGLELPAKVAEAAGRPHVDICPPSLQDKDFVGTTQRLLMRPLPFSAPGTMPAVGTPSIYLSLGTTFGTPKLLATAIEGLAGLGAQVIVATGKVRPGQVGVVPGNVSLHEWVPQAELLPHVDVVVHHGGSGTTLGALAAGVPQLMLPQGADNFANAEALAAAGVALRLLPKQADADAIAECARMLLPRGGAHRDAARAVAAEIAAMPSPDEVAFRLGDYV